MAQISRYVASTLAACSALGLAPKPMNFCLRRAPSATVPRSPACSYASLTRLTSLPKAAATAFWRRESPMPISRLSKAGATLLQSRKRTLSRSFGAKAMTSVNKASTMVWISRRLVVASILAKAPATAAYLRRFRSKTKAIGCARRGKAMGRAPTRVEA